MFSTSDEINQQIDENMLNNENDVDFIEGSDGVQSNDNISSNSNDITSNVGKSYTLNDVSEKVYGKDGVDCYFVLWNDGTYLYLNGGIDETMGRYTVIGDELHLDYLFAIDRGNDQVSSDDIVSITRGTKVLKILSKIDYSEVHSVVELLDGNATLKTLNQSAREGGNDFYIWLRQYLNRR